MKNITLLNWLAENLKLYQLKILQLHLKWKQKLGKQENWNEKWGMPEI